MKLEGEGILFFKEKLETEVSRKGLFHSVNMDAIRIFHPSLFPHKKGFFFLLQFTIFMLNHCAHIQFFHAESLLWASAVFQHFL